MDFTTGVDTININKKVLQLIWPYFSEMKNSTSAGHKIIENTEEKYENIST